MPRTRSGSPSGDLSGEGARKLAAPSLDLPKGPKQIGAPTGPEVLPPEKPVPPKQIGKAPGTDVDVRTKNVTPKPGEEPAPKGDRGVNKEVLYAHPDVARVYNNWIAKSLATTAIGPVYKAARAFKNASTMVSLGLSWAHAGLVGQEGVISEIAGALRSASEAPGKAVRGDLAGAGRSLKEAGGALAKAPVAPFQQYAKGRRFAGALLKGDMSDPLHRAFAQSGNQLKMDDFYKTRGAGSFFQSFRRGSLGADVTASLRRVIGPDKNGVEIG